MLDGLRAFGITVLVCVLAVAAVIAVLFAHTALVITLRRWRDRRAREAADRELRERDRREAVIVGSKLDRLQDVGQIERPLSAQDVDELVEEMFEGLWSWLCARDRYEQEQS